MRYMISYGEGIPTIEQYWERTYEFVHSENPDAYGITWEEAKQEVADWLCRKADRIKEQTEKEYFGDI